MLLSHQLTQLAALAYGNHIPDQVSAHDCQLASAGSQLLVLMAAMEAVQALC